MNRKYPLKMFLLGVAMNFFLRYFFLFLPGLIFCLIGIGNKTCLAIGLAFWLLDLILSLVEQFRIRKAALSESDNPEFNEIMDALYGSNDPHAIQDWVAEKIQNNPDYSAFQEEEARQQAEKQEILQKLVVYRKLKELVKEGMTLQELIAAFEEMCGIGVGEPDLLLFQTGNFNFTGEKLFHFDLVRQFQFLDDEEYVQLHLTVLYEPSAKTGLLKKIHWGQPEGGTFFQTVRNSLAYQTVNDMPIVRVDIDIHET